VSPLTSSEGLLRFGDFVADLNAGELRKHGIRIRVQVQPFQVLRILLEHPGQSVTREELQKQIWPADTFVDFDHGLNNAVKKLRQALGDDAENPRYIETLAKRGYRFIGTVENGGPVVTREAAPVPVPPKKGPLPTARGKGHVWGLGLGAAVMVGLMLVLGLNAGGVRERLFGHAVPARIRSLAVLPLENLSNDPAQEYFADGMTDALITDLSQINALKVISRTSVMRYKKTGEPLPQIARELGVDAIVEGTVTRSGDRVRISAQLIDGATDKHVWASSYERNLQDALSLQGDLAQSIAGEISVKLTPQEQVRMTHTQPINLRAMEDYLQGQYHYQKAREIGFHRGMEKRHQEELDQAIDFYQKSVGEDAHYARAYLGMAEIWGVPATFPYPQLAMEKPAREAIGKALAIDPEMAEAYVALGRIDHRAWNWTATREDVKRALELNPNLASAHDLYTGYLLTTGQMDAAMREAERVQELDPGQDDEAWVFYCQRRFDRFIELKRNDTVRHANGPLDHYELGYGYERAHMYKEAVGEWEEAMTGFGYDELAMALRHGYTKGGFKGAMRDWVAGWEMIAKQGGTVQPDLLAYLYSILDEKDRAFAWLEKSLEWHTSQSRALKIDPTVDDLRSDPRFDQLLRRVGLSP
jgi:TolB-like protein/DNA-binding winged helix-turn-helix (wHTH) protein